MPFRVDENQFTSFGQNSIITHKRLMTKALAVVLVDSITVLRFIFSLSCSVLTYVWNWGNWKLTRKKSRKACITLLLWKVDYITLHFDAAASPQYWANFQNGCPHQSHKHTHTGPGWKTTKFSFKESVLSKTTDTTRTKLGLQQSTVIKKSCVRDVCVAVSDLKRLLPSMSPDPTELQRAIEVQLLRSAVSAMNKAIQHQEQRTTASPEWVFTLLCV